MRGFLFLIATLYLFCLDAYEYELSLAKETALFGLGGVFMVSSFVKDYYNSYDFTGTPDSDEVFWADRFVTELYSEKAQRLSDTLLKVQLALPFLYFFEDRTRDRFGTIVTMYLEAVWLNFSFNRLVKVTFLRRRPFVYNPDVSDSLKDDEDAWHSFYSGHSSTAFASATFFNIIFDDFFGDYRYKEAIFFSSYLLASSVAATRVAGGKHFLTDVVAGAVVGTFCGWLVPYLHRSGKDSVRMGVLLEENGISVYLFGRF